MKKDGVGKDTNESAPDVVGRDGSELKRPTRDPREGAVNLSLEAEAQPLPLRFVGEGGMSEIRLCGRRKLEDHPPWTARKRA